MKTKKTECEHGCKYAYDEYGQAWTTCKRCTPQEQKSVSEILEQLLWETHPDVALRTDKEAVIVTKLELTKLLTDELLKKKETHLSYCKAMRNHVCECGISKYNLAIDEAIKTIERKLSE